MELKKVILSVTKRQNPVTTRFLEDVFYNPEKVDNYLLSQIRSILPNASGFIENDVLYMAYVKSFIDKLEKEKGEGTVTSVGLALPSIFTVGGSPVTVAGTLAATLATQTTNTIFAAPDGSTGTPTFRLIVPADLGTGGALNKVLTHDAIGGMAWVAPATIDQLLPTQTGNSGKYLTTNGTVSSWATVGGGGSVTSVAALTLGTTGTDLSSTVANSTTTPVITLNVPTASASNRGALSSADWTTFNNKGNGTVTSIATAGLISGGTITSSGTITTSMATNRLVGRSTAGTGVMEEITLGTGLSFSGTTLNATGGGLTVGSTAIASGTVGRMLFQGTGNVLQQSANIFWDNTNNRLSVGQGASPSATVDIKAPGTAVTDIALRVRNNGGTANNFEVTGNGRVSIGGNATGNGIFIFDTNSAGSGYYIGTAATFTGSNAYLQIATSAFKFQFGAVNDGFNFNKSGSPTDNWYFRNTQSGSTRQLAIGDTSGNIGQFIFYGENFGISDATTIGTTAKKVFWIKNGTAPPTGSGITDLTRLYSADIAAGHAALHVLNENDTVIKLYQQTTGVGSATLTTNLGTPLTSTDTYDGYTLPQIVKALRNNGLLA